MRHSTSCNGRNKRRDSELFLPVFDVIVYGQSNATKHRKNSDKSWENSFYHGISIFFSNDLDRWSENTYHLMVLFRFGWLTVLSSIKMVEQELYFLVRSPGDVWNINTNVIKQGFLTSVLQLDNGVPQWSVLGPQLSLLESNVMLMILFFNTNPVEGFQAFKTMK